MEMTRSVRSRRDGIVLPLVVVMALVLLLLAGCSSAPSTSSSPVKSETSSTPTASVVPTQLLVHITEQGFDAASLTISAGMGVTWVNEGTTTHNVTFDLDGATSGDIAPGARASHTFTKAGDFAYHDALHPALKGTVTVK
jgi:plastocyanin